MADISEFNINNTLYNLKDTQARNTIESLSTKYISLSTGGSVENSIYAINRAGLLTILDADIDNPPIEEVISGGVGNKTIDSKMYSILRTKYNSEGNLTASFEVVKNISVNNEETRKNSVNLIITSTGTNKIELDKNAWQKAINCLPLSGGTMTGQIILSDLGFRTSDDNGYQFNQWGNFQHLSSDTTNSWKIQSYDGTDKFIVNYETGNTQIRGTLSVSTPINIESGGTNASIITGNSGAVHNLFPTNLGTSIQYLNGMTQNWASTGYTKLPLPIALGGTGATTSTDALTNLGALPLSGGTLTGTLTSQQSIIIKENTYDISTSNTAANNTDRGFFVRDKNDKNLAYFIGRQSANGNVQVMINARRLNGSTNVNNYIYLKVNNDNSKSIELSDSQAWRVALGANSNGVWPISLGGTGNTTGLAASATKLATGRSIRVNLANTYDSSNPVTYDGTAAIAIPVGGTLPVAHGGTGGTDSGWESVTSSAFTGTIYYRTIGKFCEVVADPVKISTTVSSSAVELATLPTTCTPSRDFSAPANSTATNGMITIKKSDRKIRIYRISKVGDIAQNSNIYFHFMYTKD